MDFFKSILIVFLASMSICCFGQDCLLTDEIEAQKPVEEGKCYEYIHLPDLYEIITERVLAPPSPDDLIMSEVMIKTTRTLVREAHCDWVEIICEKNETLELYYEIKYYLRARGYYWDYPLNSFKTRKMMEALILFQKDNGLPYESLNIETLRALGVDYKALGFEK